MKKKTVSMFMGLVLGVTTVFSSIGPAVVTVSAAAAESGVTDSDCTDKSTKEPESDKVVPDANQYKYQKDELAAFCHFGPNTFNEIEWGEHYGDKKPSEIFTLKDNFDADTLVRTLKNAGFKKLIITAKHHDGFCIWPSKYTEYDAEAAGYKGDILAEISAACTTYNMDMGLYLSPWDIHEPSYGYYDANGKPTSKENDVLDYNEYYNNQLEEILGNSKYGNNGHFVEVWMDGAKGSGANAQDYEFTKWFDTIQKHQGKRQARMLTVCYSELRHIQPFAGLEMKMALLTKTHGQNLKSMKQIIQLIATELHHIPLDMQMETNGPYQSVTDVLHPDGSGEPKRTLRRQLHSLLTCILIR